MHTFGQGCLERSELKCVVQVPSSPLLPAALPALLAALTAACQQGGDAALANRVRGLVVALGKAQAQAASPTPGDCCACWPVANVQNMVAEYVQGMLGLDGTSVLVFVSATQHILLTAPTFPLAECTC